MPKTRSAGAGAARTTRAKGDSATPTSNGSRSCVEKELQPQPKATPRVSRGKKASVQTPSSLEKNEGEDQLRVTGSRMSNVKHSGLLARDEALRLMEEEEHEEPLQLSPNILTGPGGLGQHEEEKEHDKDKKVTGRELFTIATARRSTKKSSKTKQPLMNGDQTPQREIDCGKEMSSTKDDADDETNKTGTVRKRAAAKSKNHLTQGDDEIAEKRNGVGGEDGEEEEPEKESRSRRRRKLIDSAARPTRGGRERRRRTRQTQLSSESEIDESVDEEDEDDDDMETVAAQLNRGNTTEQVLEDYFTQHSGKAGPTSDHTLSRLTRPRLEQETIQTAVGDVPAIFQRDCHELLAEHAQLYPYWLLQIESGLNILLYGLGSKKTLIDNFRKKCLGGSCHLVVNGYFPGLTMKQLLNSLSANLLGHSGSFKLHTEHAQFITNSLEKRSRDIPPEVFLLIHNIDGPMLRNEKAQTALSILASSPSIHVVASVDHINSPLLWDQTRLGRFKWAWHDVTTFHNYREETSYENSLLVQQSGALALSSLTHVMQSLTPNARKIFELLARYQVDKKEEEGRSYQGLSFSECYRRCREGFLVNSDLTLRAQLTEFIDHKLVKSAKGSDGVEYLTVPLDDATLSQFLSEFDS